MDKQMKQEAYSKNILPRKGFGINTLLINYRCDQFFFVP